MSFSLISLNIGKDKKAAEPMNVICQPKPSRWRAFIELIQILSCLIGIAGIVFAAAALRQSEKAHEIAAASLTKTEEALRITQRSVLSATQDPIESLKGHYRLLRENDGVVVEISDRSGS